MQFKNDLLLRTIKGEKTERTPVWLMRQAGRILPEYRKVRNQLNGFKELVETPERAAEVTIQPVDLLEVDAAIIFSDILVVPQAMGLSYEMVEQKGPWFPSTVRSFSDLKNLHVAETGAIQYTIDAIRETRINLNGRVPLIGFAGAPWTIFAYMVEGSGSKTFSAPRGMLYYDPKLAHELLRMITESTIHYLHEQVRAGADVVQIFDSWAGILPSKLYEEFSIPYLKKICESVNEVPVTLFAKDAYFARKMLSELECETIGLDWCVDIQESRQIVGDKKILQGNLDPAVLYGGEEVIRKETRKMLDTFGPYRHIANLGHGVYPDIEPESVKIFIDEVKTYSRESR